MIDVTLAWRPPTWATMSPHWFAEATTCTTRAPLVGSAGAAPQPATAAARSSAKTKPETVFITGSVHGHDRTTRSRARSHGPRREPADDLVAAATAVATAAAGGRRRGGGLAAGLHGVPRELLAGEGVLRA